VITTSKPVLILQPPVEFKTGTHLFCRRFRKSSLDAALRSRCGREAGPGWCFT